MYAPSHPQASPAAECRVWLECEDFLRCPPQAVQTAGSQEPASATCTDLSAKVVGLDCELYKQTTHPYASLDNMLQSCYTFLLKCNSNKAKRMWEHTDLVDLLYEHLLEKSKRQNDCSICVKHTRISKRAQEDKSNHFKRVYVIFVKQQQSVTSGCMKVKWWN